MDGTEKQALTLAFMAQHGCDRLPAFITQDEFDEFMLDRAFRRELWRMDPDSARWFMIDRALAMDSPQALRVAADLLDRLDPPQQTGFSPFSSGNATMKSQRHLGRVMNGQQEPRFTIQLNIEREEKVVN